MYFGKDFSTSLTLDLEAAVEAGIENVLSKSETFFNSINSVPKNIESTILTYTVSIGRKFIILGGTGATMTDATFKIYIDDVLFEIKRTAWTQRNIDFKIKKKVAAGSIIKITGEHNSHLYNVGYAHDLEASLIGLDLPI